MNNSNLIHQSIYAAIWGGFQYASCIKSIEIGLVDLNISLMSASRAFLPLDEPPAPLGSIMHAHGIGKLLITCTNPELTFIAPLLHQMRLMLANSSLKTISITRCKLTGSLSQIDFISPHVTEHIDLSHNLLSGTIPSSWISCADSEACFSFGKLIMKLGDNPDLEYPRQPTASLISTPIIIVIVLASCFTAAFFIWRLIVTRRLGAVTGSSLPISRRISTASHGDHGGMGVASASHPTNVVRRASANGSNK